MLLLLLLLVLMGYRPRNKRGACFFDHKEWVAKFAFQDWGFRDREKVRKANVEKMYEDDILGKKIRRMQTLQSSF